MGKTPIYIATATAYDAEMTSKIEMHQNRRDDIWHTIDAPLDVATALNSARENNAVLLDCATLWLTNLMFAQRDSDAETTLLLDALRSCAAPVTIVSNDVGGGITPDNAMARRFQRIQGTFNQRIAAELGTVILVTAGLPLVLKGQI